jgi:hypothetical protein
MTEPFVLDLAVGGFLEPLAVRTPYTASRLAVLADGVPTPVLGLLAKIAYGDFSSDLFPFWADGDPSNETLENVALAQRTRKTYRRLGLSGPDYRKRWREANPDRARQYAVRAAARRALLAAAAAEEKA